MLLFAAALGWVCLRLTTLLLLLLLTCHDHRQIAAHLEGVR